MTVSIATSTETDPSARGRTFGQEWAPEILSTWQAYESLFAAHRIEESQVREIALRTLDVVAEWSPPLSDEILAIGDGSGLADWQVAALNSRSEVLTRSRLQGRGECSTVVYLPHEGPPRTIQTWDWQYEMNDVKVVWGYQPRPNWAVKTFTEFGVLGKVGVNTAGLGLHFNLLQHVTDGEGFAVPVHLMARRILDEAATILDADEIIHSSRATASAALTVVAPSGNTAARYEARSFELAPAGVAELQPNADGLLFHTNHFIDPLLAKGERYGVVDNDTYDRIDELQRRADKLSATDFGARVEGLVHHLEDGAAICCHPEPGSVDGDRWATNLVIGLEVDRPALVFQDGAPCTASESGYVRF